jgi:hypothetical protein
MILKITEEKIISLSPKAVELIELLDFIPESDKPLILSYLAKQVSREEMCKVTIEIDTGSVCDKITYDWGKESSIDNTNSQ